MLAGSIKSMGIENEQSAFPKYVQVLVELLLSSKVFETFSVLTILGAIIIVHAATMVYLLPRTLKNEPNRSPDAFVARPPIFETMSTGFRPTLPLSLSAASLFSNCG